MLSYRDNKRIDKIRVLNVFKVNFADYFSFQKQLLNLGNFLPPMQAPNVKAQIRGCIGRSSSRFCARFVAILTIIVASGTLSTKALAMADTQSSNSMATANRDSSLTDRMILSVCLPIQAISPKRERACKIFNSIFLSDFNRTRRAIPRKQCIKSNTAIIRIDITSISINSDAKNSKVLHSTRAMTPSKSSLSANIRSSITPIRAVQPSDKFN